MDDDYRRRLLKFGVTPMAEQAAAALRALLPTEDGTVMYLLVEKRMDRWLCDAALRRRVGGTGWKDTPLNLTNERAAAAELLMAAGAYHYFLIRGAWRYWHQRNPNCTYAPDLPQYGKKAVRVVSLDVRQQLRIEIDSLSYPSHKVLRVFP
ncbi:MULTISPECIES: hypothetical protein [unclassified Streptomyces]|uniref:hypothetical protein n=1 Tax=unclassified Streptomyces TaxID=2593676 RepID=UPI00081E2442|nr:MULTISPECIES: hypothetical protein [unclassified Streptomyces]MYZ33937.1 hypothetical protein [Streptomyces sp. SID4917]SCF62836.1 hypothetical protein GA0115259_1003418 [Streptomyces sp. MnatMP-M17]